MRTYSKASVFKHSPISCGTSFRNFTFPNAPTLEGYSRSRNNSFDKRLQGLTCRKLAGRRIWRVGWRSGVSHGMLYERGLHLQMVRGI